MGTEQSGHCCNFSRAALTLFARSLLRVSSDVDAAHRQHDDQKAQDLYDTFTAALVAKHYGVLFANEVPNNQHENHIQNHQHRDDL